MAVPNVQYVRAGDTHLAYMVLGEGPDLVLTPGGWNHLLGRWELPETARFFRHLASFSHVILWDKRGTGLSDRQGSLPTLDAQKTDLGAILDAAGSDRAVLFGAADGAVVTAYYAATHPERVAATVLMGAAVRFAPGLDGSGVSPEFLAALESGGSPDQVLALLSPDRVDDPVFCDWWRRYAPSAASPGTVAEFLRIWMQIDISAVLPALRAPTTVIQRTEDLIFGVANGRDLAARIPNARYVELPGGFATWSGNTGLLADELEEIVTGARRGADPQRMLATIVFTDIVGSTTTAASLGDRAWSAMLDAHDELVGRVVSGFGGRVVKSLGDGMLSVFDSPTRGVQCASALVGELAGHGIPIRAGVHTGECERREEDVGGLAVHIAARVSGLAGAGEILATGTVRDLVVGSGLEFADRGEQGLRGVPGTWRVLQVV